MYIFSPPSDRHGATIVKKMMLFCFSILIFAPFPLGAEDLSPSFALYLVKERNAVINDAVLESSPLITDQDIVSYDWENHIITLTEKGSKKIPQEPGAEFIIVVNGHRCYQGAFWSSVLSSSYGKPIIDVLKNNHVLRIERAYPSEKFAEGADPRSDERIKKAIEFLGKLNNPEPSR